MAGDELSTRRAELAELQQRIAPLEARMPRSHQRPTPAPPPTAAPPSATAAPVAPPPTSAAAPPPPPEAGIAPVDTAARPPEPPPAPLPPPVRPQTTPIHPPASPPATASAPRRDQSATNGGRRSRGNGRRTERRQVETATGWRATRWLLVLATVVTMGVWIVGGLLFSGLTGNQMRERSSPAAPPPVAVPSPSVVASSAAALAPTLAPSPTRAPATAVPIVAGENVLPTGVAVPATGAPAAVPPTALPTIVPTAARTTAPTIAPAPAQPGADRAIGSAVISAPTGFSGALLRGQPSQAAAAQRFLPNGTAVEVFDGATTADNFRWSRVRTDDGAVGWIVSVTIGQ